MIKKLKVPGDLKKRILNGLLIGCMALVSLLVVDPDETKAVTTSDIYWVGSSAYISTQAGLNEACDRKMTADIYLLNDITLEKRDGYSTKYPTGISVYGVKTLHGNGEMQYGQMMVMPTQTSRKTARRSLTWPIP